MCEDCKEFFGGVSLKDRIGTITSHSRLISDFQVWVRRVVCACFIVLLNVCMHKMHVMVKILLKEDHINGP